VKTVTLKKDPEQIIRELLAYMTSVPSRDAQYCSVLAIEAITNAFVQIGIMTDQRARRWREDGLQLLERRKALKGMGPWST